MVIEVLVNNEEGSGASIEGRFAEGTPEGNVRRVGRRSRQLLLRAESQEAIRVSPVTLFELAALHTLGRVRLTRPLEQWVRDSLGSAGVRIAELTPGIAMDAGNIPRAALADQLDRLFVATARHLDAVFLTADVRILDNAAKTGNARVHDAGV